MDVKKSRSVYCTEGEYQRLKVALSLIRLYDRYGSVFFRNNFDKKSFWQIMKGFEKHGQND